MRSSKEKYNIKLNIDDSFLSSSDKEKMIYIKYFIRFFFLNKMSL